MAFFLTAAIWMATAVVCAVAWGAWADADHVYSFSFSGTAPSRVFHPVDIAVDNSEGSSAHDIYVVDSFDHRVKKFDREGLYLGALDGSFSGPSRVAVDGSTGPSAGDVYVVDFGNVRKFDLAGQPILEWGVNGGLPFASVEEVAVDPDGRLLVVGVNGSRALAVFDQAGSKVSEFSTALIPAGGLAAASDAIFMTAGVGTVEELALDGAAVGSVGSRSDGDDLALDSTHEGLYVGQRAGFLSRYPEGCAPAPCVQLEAFGSQYLDPTLARRAIGVDESDETVYATDLEGVSNWQVDVFRGAGILPSATTGFGSRTEQSVAILDGLADPAGAGAVTECGFEIVDTGRFKTSGFTESTTVPCDPPPPFTGSALVSGRATGLDPKTTYHYRLTLRNAAGPASGATELLPPIPKVTIEPATQTFQTSTLLRGQVDNDGNETPVAACRFELVEEKAFELTAWTQAVPHDCTPPAPFSAFTSIPVSAAVSGLTPGTKYRFRLVASTPNDTIRSASDGFSTQNPEFDDPFVDGELVRKPHKRVPCARRACVRSLKARGRSRVWRSPRFPPGFGWIFDLRRGGDSLHHSKLSGGCRATFRGRGVQAKLNSCPNRFRLRFRGSGTFVVKWRVFEYCRCASVGSGATHRGHRRRPGAAP